MTTCSKREDNHLTLVFHLRHQKFYILKKHLEAMITKYTIRLDGSIEKGKVHYLGDTYHKILQLGVMPGIVSEEKASKVALGEITVMKGQ